jgi:RND family efflux transporter MFP subunit
MSAKSLWIKGMLLLAMAAGFVGCNHEPPVTAPEPAEVAVSKPASEKIADWDVYTGTVDSKESVNVEARVKGQIKEVLFTEGDEIKKDKLLFVIDDAPFQADLKQAKGQVIRGQEKLKAAEETITIYKPLVEKGTVSRQDMVNALANKGEALGAIATALGKEMEAEVNIAYCKIKAPISGKIGQALLTEGNMVSPGPPGNLLTTIVSVDPLYVYFSVNERALRRYQEVLRKQFEKDKKSDIKIPVEMALAGDESYPYKGIIDFIDNKVDPNTGSIKVRARFKNDKGSDGRRLLTPGLFARVRVAIGNPYPALLVVDRAILTDQSLKYVLVVNKEKKNVVERKDITASSRVQENGLRAVEGGLTGDEWIIVDGVNRVRPGVTANPKEAPMPRRPASGK